MPDLEDPELVVSEGEDDAPISDAERPEPMSRMGQRFGVGLRMFGQTALDGPSHPILDRVVESGNVAGDNQWVVEETVPGHRSGPGVVVPDGFFRTESLEPFITLSGPVHLLFVFTDLLEDVADDKGDRNPLSAGFGSEPFHEAGIDHRADSGVFCGHEILLRKV